MLWVMHWAKRHLDSEEYATTEQNVNSITSISMTGVLEKQVFCLISDDVWIGMFVCQENSLF